MTAQEWLERFDALCQDAWALGRMDIADTARLRVGGFRKRGKV